MPWGTVLDALEDAAARNASRRALSYIETVAPDIEGVSWTHAEFIAVVRQAARLFNTLAGGDTPRVAMLLPAIPEAYFTLWGAEAVGVACPINYLLNPEHIAELVNASGANLVVALGPNPQLDIWSKAADLREHCPGLRKVLAVRTGRDAPALPEGVVDFMAALSAESSQPLTAAEKSPLALAAMFHTGGTTGHPKLAQHVHRNQLHAAWGAACMYGATHEDVCLNPFPLFHVAGSFVYGLSTLMSGGEVVLPTLLGLRNKAVIDHYWRIVEHSRTTLLAAVPTVMASVLGVPFGQDQLRAVRCLLTGGSPLPTELADAFEQRTGLPVRNILGMTECGGVISIEPVASPRQPGSVGLPLPFTTVSVRDEHGREMPAGEEGIVWLCGPNVGPGYTEAERNAGTFEREGWLVTGDVGHLAADGTLFLTGRAKDLIIRSSHNIDPVVIEDALLKHPEVLMAAAVGAPDEYAGEVPVAYVALKPGSRLSSDALLDFARGYIPERPAWPKSIGVLDALPTTAIGKIFKPALRALAIEAVIAERLEAAGASSRVQAEAITEGRQMVVRFTGASEAGDAAHVKAVMSRFALKYRIEEGGAP